MSYQLSLDTCTKACSVSILKLNYKYKQLDWFEILEHDYHAEIVADKVKILFKKMNISAKEISQIAVTVGPGTFTGTRIALAFARMFALARKIPIISINSLEAIMFNIISKFVLNKINNIYVVMNAMRDQIYFASYDSVGKEILSPRIIEVSDIINNITDNIILVGTARNLILKKLLNYHNFIKLTYDMNFPNAGIFANYIKHYKPSKHDVSPLYLRKVNAKISSNHPFRFTE